jgi:hypothetical protein
MGIRRYLYPAWSIDEYLICLSTSPVNWTVSEVDTTTFKFVHGLMVWRVVTDCDGNLEYRIPPLTLCSYLAPLRQR